MIGPRDGGITFEFMNDLASRLANRVQLTTEGHKAYREAVGGALGSQIDYAQLVKLYGVTKGDSLERKYSPNVCLGARPTTVIGNPDIADISTSFVERQNLTMRMSMRRMTRLTNGFSKKLENLGHAVALHFTPAMQTCISDHDWSLEEITALAAENLN